MAFASRLPARTSSRNARTSPFSLAEFRYWSEEADLESTRALIADTQDVPGYKSLESDGFEKNPLRNAVLAFLILIMGMPFPFWYRRAKSSSTAN